MPEKTNIHAGHRKRLKERYRKAGLDHFNEINALELLLFYCVQRKDTNPLAHRLLDRFGTISDVLKASPDELMCVPGVTEHIAVFLSLVMSMNRYCLVNEAAQVSVLRTMDDCVRYVRPLFHGFKQEVVYMVCLDARCKVICCKKLSEGSVNETNFPIRRMVEIAMQNNASSVLIAHNHPSGDLVPSADDIRATDAVARGVKLVNIRLVDHLIITDKSYTSIVDFHERHPELK